MLFPREDPHEEIACVGLKIVAVFGELVSVFVSASWKNSHYTLSLVSTGMGVIFSGHTTFVS